MTRQEAQKLFEKHNRGLASLEEEIRLEQWYHQEQAKQRLSEEEADFFFLKDQIWHGTLKRSGLTQPHSSYKSVKHWPGIATAAAVILVVAAGLFFYVSRQNQQDNNAKLALLRAQEDARGFVPGNNKAILTLSNGQKISLTDVKNGELARQAGVEISKTTDGQLVYKIIDNRQSKNTTVYNSVETPRGGQHQIRLPDGSKVWLNAASSLKYPVSFATLKERSVELSGEAYFEVAKDRRHPFVVKSAGQQVEVLGTHFNISSYTDEPSTKTTLLEGAVKINKELILKPGEQANLSKTGKITVSEEDVNGAVAWKNGLFSFQNADIQTVMRQMSRWYNVDVEYEGKIPEAIFTGKFYRNENASQLLRLLTFYKIKYRIARKKIIIIN